MAPRPEEPPEGRRGDGETGPPESLPGSGLPGSGEGEQEDVGLPGGVPGGGLPGSGEYEGEDAGPRKRLPGGELPGSGEGGQEDAGRRRGLGRARMPLPVQGNKYGRWIGGLVVIFVIAVTIITILTKPNGAAGLRRGEQVPVFAVPLLDGEVEKKADIAIHANERERGKVPACKERGQRILNICELYERGPVVLALFSEGGSCTDVLSEMEAVAPSFPKVSFAAVSILGNPGALRTLTRKRGITFPVGFDDEGQLAALFKFESCPQVSFIDKGGKVQSSALLVEPPKATLRARIAALVTASQRSASQQSVTESQQIVTASLSVTASRRSG
jgi:AhpC/TSA family